VILVDTSVWVVHFRRPDAVLRALIAEGGLLLHPFVLGELVLGGLSPTTGAFADLQLLEEPQMASAEEVLAFIDSAALAGTGIGYVNAHLLASCRLTSGVVLWTHDKRLRAQAGILGIGFEP
jgi:predicted nucleic acid-binding protein